MPQLAIKGVFSVPQKLVVILSEVASSRDQGKSDAERRNVTILLW